jgi:acyl transferase domain-containing protein
MDFKQHNHFEDVVRKALAAYQETLESAIEEEPNPLDVQALEEALQDAESARENATAVGDMVRACGLLHAAYEDGESVDWTDLDLASERAEIALDTLEIPVTEFLPDE